MENSQTSVNQCEGQRRGNTRHRTLFLHSPCVACSLSDSFLRFSFLLSFTSRPLTLLYCIRILTISTTTTTTTTTTTDITKL
ncbi:hypothetical protein E2C01_043403 [Portunus trituberculatus]|uniref:Uncharacterized protein n=1 Tax=Portunus trituberculatus TaxID=210409 RepID=A0A5B7FWA5_PORTR|nr:hypothetical protein [Portunus trituberculatus]